MQKRTVTKGQYNFLENELNYSKQNQIINEEQCNNILDLYVIKKKISFVSVLLVIGSILIGLGVLTFIAANWEAISKTFKLLIIFGIFFTTGFASYKLWDSFPKTSRSLLYLAGIIYGAGIFLIGQIFNLGGHFTIAFLLWGVGIFPIAILFKDKIIFAFANILFLVYLNGYFSFEDKIPWVILLILPTIYLLNYKFLNSQIVTFFNTIIALNTIAFFGVKLDMEASLVILLFVVGLLMYFVPFPEKYHSFILKLQGSIVFGVTGFIMTFEDYWGELFGYSYSKYSPYSRSMIADIDLIISIVFSILFIALLLYLVKKGSIVSLVFACIVILKFYFDLTYDFMDKSLFFLIGGALLVGLGVYLEKMRRKTGGIANEKQEVI